MKKITDLTSVVEKIKNPIIAALDVPTAEQALKLAAQIAPAVGAFKIGKEIGRAHV